MPTSTKVKKQEVSSLADEALAKYVRKDRTREAETPKAETQAQDTPITQKFVNIESNPFHKIVLQTDAAPQEKQKMVAQALAFEEGASKEENAAKIAAFEEFKEYLMAWRKEMAKEIIRLSDTEAFGELQKVFGEMNQSLLDFENMISPLVSIIDAVNRLNMASDGAIYDVYKEIQEDKAAEAKAVETRQQQERQLSDYGSRVKRLGADISILSEQKSWFGMGGIKKEALAAIEEKRDEIQDVQNAIAQLREDMTKVRSRESKYAEFAQEKAKLRELLDLTRDQNKERQEALIKAALNFVNTTEERSGSVLSHMQKIKAQIGNVDDVNGKMQKVFAIINEGVKDAEDSNRTLTGKFQTAATDESQVERIEREEKLRALHEHVEITTASKIDTLETLGALQEESMNIRTMRETNRQQINATRKMHSSGTAGVASRLSTVLTAVSSAALNEARTATQNTISNMGQITADIAQSEAIKNATQLHIQNDEFAKAIEQLASFREISDKASVITRAAIEESKSLQADMERTARELEQSIKQLKGVTADVMQEGGPSARGAVAEQDNRNPAPAGPSFSGFRL